MKTMGTLLLNIYTQIGFQIGHIEICFVIFHENKSLKFVSLFFHTLKKLRNRRFDEKSLISKMEEKIVFVSS